jgi:hypothetical protein
MICNHGYEPECVVTLDTCWIAMKFKKAALKPLLKTANRKAVAISMEA